MKNILIILILLTLFSISCQTKAESVEINPNESNSEILKIKSEFSPTPTPKPKRQDINSKIGNVKIGNKCIRLFIDNAQLKVGDKVQIVLPEGNLQKISDAEIIQTSECKDVYFGDLIPNNNITEYLLRLTKENDINRGFGIGIVNTDEKLKIKNGLATIDINNDKKNEYFRECTSTEGLHLTVWTGKPLKGKRIWHSYYNFNYDTVPNCKEEDWENIDG